MKRAVNVVDRYRPSPDLACASMTARSSCAESLTSWPSTNQPANRYPAFGTAAAPCGSPESGLTRSVAVWPGSPSLPMTLPPAPSATYSRLTSGSGCHCAVYTALPVTVGDTAGSHPWNV